MGSWFAAWWVGWQSDVIVHQAAKKHGVLSRGNLCRIDSERNRKWLDNSLLQYSTTNNQWVLGRRKRSWWLFLQIVFSHLDGCPCVVCVEMRLPCSYLAHLVIMSLRPFVKVHAGGRILFRDQVNGEGQMISWITLRFDPAAISGRLSGAAKYTRYSGPSFSSILGWGRWTNICK